MSQLELSQREKLRSRSRSPAVRSSPSPTESQTPQLSISAHVMPVEDVCRYYKVDPLKGLTPTQVAQQRTQYGFNELHPEERKSLLSLLVEQFNDLLARILLIAALLSFVLALISGGASNEGLAAFVEPLVILLILVANAVVSVWQESNAEKSLDALKRLQSEVARVLRNSEWCTIPSRELVPGDVCEVRVGDRVPADIRLIKLNTVTLRVEQSQFTGESAAVTKDMHTLHTETHSDCELQLRTNILYATTTISNGSGVGVVVATGMQTEIGKVQSAVQQAAARDEPTPLQQKLDEFGELLSKIIGVICVLVWAINFRNFSDPSHGGFLRGCVYYFKTAVALAVAAIPEGLTAVITTCLALGTRKMAQKNAIVRRLPSVETLGCTTVICSDKTGTLTTNEMSCVRFSIPKNEQEINVYTVEGHSYLPYGKVRQHLSKEALPHVLESHIGLRHFLKCASLCNDARLRVNLQTEKFSIQGEPTEAALKVLVEKLGCPDEALNSLHLQKKNRQDPEAFSRYWEKGLKRLAVLEFSRDRKSMSVFCRDESLGKTIQYVKGAPETILERCSDIMLPSGNVVPLTPRMKQRLYDELTDMASHALRTLALAVRLDTGEFHDYSGPDHPQHAKLELPENYITLEQNLIFCGLVGLMDPPRPEVQQAIQRCTEAGIKVIMITGDNKLTAEAVATKVGIVDADELHEVSLTGKQFEMLPEEEQFRVLSAPRGAVFSRTEPKHKQMIIRVLKDLGEIVAMTGDGVNDAPALKQADIGIAMGVTGTEVAKEASDMVLADDNFMTIVLAVEEGRSIYNNMKAFIRYLISSNIGEVASIFLTAALGIPEGLAPVQLLWVNLVTDGFPATALGFNPPDVDVMKKQPRRREDPLISPWVLFRYLVIGLYVGFATVGIFVCWFVWGVDPTDGHTLISFSQLSQWGRCHSWPSFTVNTVYAMNPTDPCSYFHEGKIKASTLSLTVLVVIEMFNAFNALSEDGSLLELPPWANPWLILSVFGSIAVHCAILYIQPLATIFSVVPLTFYDWLWVVLWSFPVLLIDEALKAYARRYEKTKEHSYRQLSNHSGRPKKLQ